jgi:hypothetical protein
VRLPRTALALMAGLVLVTAGACSSNATTAPAGGGPAANQNDPNAILSSAISGGADIKSVHIKIAVSGTITKAALQAAMAGSGSGTQIPITTDAKLDGTAIEGDVDVANSAAHFTLNVPALQMMGNQPITGDLILVSNTLYYQVSLLGAKYSKQDLGSLANGLPVSIPSVIPSPGATAMTGELAQLQQQMKDAGVSVNLVGVDKIGGQDANHLNVSFPLDKINASIAAEASGGPAMTLDSASADFWIYKANNQLAQIDIKGASSSLGNLELMITLTNYNQPVTISAPAASNVNP